MISDMKNERKGPKESRPDFKTLSVSYFKLHVSGWDVSGWEVTGYRFQVTGFRLGSFRFQVTG